MSHNDLLRIQNLKVCAGEKEILHGIDLDIHENEVHVLMGPNGTGKSTLGAALMGNPAYTVTGGDIIYKGQNINEMPDNERAKNGIFLSFQNPIEIPGITVSAFIRSALEAKTGKRIRLFSFKKELEEKMELLQMDPSYAERDLNVGFSGGEKKKTEILQMLMPNPAHARAEARHPRRDRLRSGCRRSPHRFQGHRGIPETVQGQPAGHHPQHQNPGGSAGGLYTHHGKRKDRQNFGQLADRRSQREWFRSLRKR